MYSSHNFTTSNQDLAHHWVDFRVFFTETHREEMIDDVPRKQMKYVYAENEIIVKIPAMSMSDLHLR